MRLIDADALYNGAMKDEYFDFVSHDNHGRESFAYSCAMQRLSEAPTIDAIPIEWLLGKREHCKSTWDIDLYEAVQIIFSEWQKEQEAQECSGT